jgi:hypothetical protein
MPVKALHNSFSILNLTGMRRRREFQARCHQTNNPRGKGTTETWTLVAEYPTTSGMATDVPDIVDAMYHDFEEYMHACVLRMDENHVRSPTDFHMWRLVQETIHSMYWNCPMKWLCGCTAGTRIVETRNSLRLEKTRRHDEESHQLVQKKVTMSARSTSREAAGIKLAYPHGRLVFFRQRGRLFVF